MKILHLIQKPQKRGAETFASQLANHQAERDHEVWMAAIFPGDGKLPWKGDLYDLKGSVKTRMLDVASWKKLSDLVRKIDPDIVQANAGDTLKYAVFSRLLFGWKAPIIFRNASEVGSYLRTGYQKRFNGFLYRNIRGVISVSEASGKNLLQHYPFLAKRMTVIPIGLEEKGVIPYTLMPEGGKHIVHVGGFTFEKNHRGLIRIFAQVFEQDPEAHLHLLGDGPLRRETEEQVIDGNLRDNVHFYGFVEDPLRYIEAASVLVLPSIIEGLPGVLLEAMYCETPVVAYDVGGISEIVHQGTGHLIREGKEDEFAGAVLAAINHPDKDRVKRARNMVKTNFMNTNISQKFLAAYQQFVVTKD